MNRVLKILFFALIVKPLALVVLGLNIRGRRNLPATGPAVIVANHNSHLDTVVLMSLYPLAQVHKVKPVAAADYFLKNRFLKWFSLRVIGIIPLARKSRQKKDELFAACKKALEDDDILILYPEGSRGEAGKMSQFKKGVFYVSKLADDVKVTPVVLNGLNKALPKGEALLVPFNCDVIIGQGRSSGDSADEFMAQLTKDFDELFDCCLSFHG